MASLEEMMAGLFGGMEARGAQGLGDVGPIAEDPRRRRAGRGSGYEGISGGNVSLASLLPHLQGLPFYDYSGPMRGLADLLPGMDIQGPSRRHLERQGEQFQQPFIPPGLAGGEDLPPGVDTRNALGGPNVAPGNIDTGTALFQPPGQANRPMPQTQGWRNVAPGYSAAAQLGYGTPGFENAIRGGLGGIAGGSVVAPGQTGGGGGGGGAAKGVGGGAGGAAPAAGGAPAATPGAGAAKPVLGGGGGGGAKTGAPGAAKTGGGPGAAKQPKQSQIGAKKAPGASTGGGGRNPVAAKKDTGGGTVGGPASAKVTAKVGAKKSPKTQTTGGVVGGVISKAGQAVGQAISGPAPKPAPAPSAGAAKQTTFTPAKPGKTKPKGGTSLVGGVFR